MQPIIKVPGIFLADAYNTPLAKTVDIFDDIQEKYQQEINNDLYQKIENSVSVDGALALSTENKDTVLKSISAVGFQEQNLTPAELRIAKLNIGIEDYATAELIHLLFN